MTKGVQDRMVEVERIRDAFQAAVFVARDVDAAVALAGDGISLVNQPTGSGATGADELRGYLGELVLPADLAFRRISRTGDRWRVAQEDLVSFTHDRELPWLLPGLPATGRRAEVLAISVVTINRSVVDKHRTLWDLTTLLAQLQPESARELGDPDPGTVDVRHAPALGQRRAPGGEKTDPLGKYNSGNGIYGTSFAAGSVSGALLA